MTAIKHELSEIRRTYPILTAINYYLTYDSDNLLEKYNLYWIFHCCYWTKNLIYWTKLQFLWTESEFYWTKIEFYWTKAEIYWTKTPPIGQIHPAIRQKSFLLENDIIFEDTYNWLKRRD